MKITPTAWDQDRALKTKRAITRDGRDVFDLHIVEIDGKEALAGMVALVRPPYKREQIIKTEWHIWWSLGGLGGHGGDDLMCAIE